MTFYLKHLNGSVIKIPQKHYAVKTAFNINNNNNNNTKCFLSCKSAYYYDFWRSCDTEDWSNDAENTAFRHRYKLHFIIYLHRKHLFLIIIIFLNITEFL